MNPITFNLDTAAARIGVTRRWLLEWLWKHPCDANGTPFYRRAGRTKLFTEADCARIVAALPVPEAPCRIMPSGAATYTSAAHVRRAAQGQGQGQNDYIALRELLKSASPNKRSASSSGTSKVVPVRGPRTRPSRARP